MRSPEAQQSNGNLIAFPGCEAMRTPSRENPKNWPLRLSVLALFLGSMGAALHYTYLLARMSLWHWAAFWAVYLLVAGLTHLWINLRIPTLLWAVAVAHYAWAIWEPYGRPYAVLLFLIGFISRRLDSDYDCWRIVEPLPRA